MQCSCTFGGRNKGASTVQWSIDFVETTCVVFWICSHHSHKHSSGILNNCLFIKPHRWKWVWPYKDASREQHHTIGVQVPAISELFSASSEQFWEPYLSFMGHCITNWTRYFEWERSCNCNVTYKYGWCASDFIFEFMLFSHPTIHFPRPTDKNPTGDFVIVLIHAAHLLMIGHHQRPIYNLQINLSHFQSVMATPKAAELKTTSSFIPHAQFYQIICVIHELMS